MDTDTQSRDTTSQADDGGRPLPYPISHSDIGFWLRRGELLGRTACWIAATVADGHKRAATWRRHVASKGPGHPPPAPG